MAIVRVDALLDSFGGQKAKEDKMLTVQRIEALLPAGSDSSLAQRIYTALITGGTQQELQDWLEMSHVVPVGDASLSEAIFREMTPTLPPVPPPPVHMPAPVPAARRSFFPVWAALVLAILVVAVAVLAIQLYFTHSWVESDSGDVAKLEKAVAGLKRALGGEFLAAASTWAHPEELKCENVAAQSVDDCLREKSLPCAMVCCNRWAQLHPQYMGTACRQYIVHNLGPPTPYPPPAPPKS